MILEGLIAGKDIEDAKSNTGSRVFSIGLPAYCLFKKLVHSAKHSSSGILLGKWTFFVLPPGILLCVLSQCL